MRIGCLGAFCWAAASAQTTMGQLDWSVFEDTQSISLCDVVNTVDNQLVVLTDTNQLMLVSRTDTVLSDSFVNANNFVFFLGEAVGVIDFADDGDGFRTLWWLSLDGRVVQIDPFTATPSASEFFPEDFIEVPCDACEFVDLAPEGVCDVPLDEGSGTDVVIDVTPISVEFCGTGMGSMMMLTCCGFVGFRAMRRPIPRR